MSEKSKYKQRVSRRGTHLHPAARLTPPWWLRDAEMRELVLHGPFAQCGPGRPRKDKDERGPRR